MVEITEEVKCMVIKFIEQAYCSRVSFKGSTFLVIAIDIMAEFIVVVEVAEASLPIQVSKIY